MARTISSGNYLLNNGGDSYDFVGDGLGYVIAAWIKPNVVTGATDYSITSRFPGSGHGILLRFMTGKVRLFTIDGSGSGKEAIGVTTFTQGLWQLAGGQWAGNTANLEVWKDGVQDATSGTVTTDGNSPNEPNSWGVGIRCDGSNPFDGAIGEVTWWKNCTLTSAEWLALAKGISPLHIRRNKIVSYWPIWGASPEPELARGAGSTPQLTLTGTPAVANHAPMGSPPFCVVIPSA